LLRTKFKLLGCIITERSTLSEIFPELLHGGTRIVTTRSQTKIYIGIVGLDHGTHIDDSFLYMSLEELLSKHPRDAIQ